MLTDVDGPFPLSEEWDVDLASGDPLGFPGYADKIASLDRESVRTGLCDGFVVIEGDFGVLGGSMGVVHGEKVVRAFDRARSQRRDVVVITRSGGARMQEGMVALIQMARTAAAVTRHRESGLLSVAVHRSPTTGGVFASYSSLCSLRAAEAGAIIGFAGPRVVEQTTGEVVGDSSHTAEEAAAAGLVDAVVEADEIGPWVLGCLGRFDRPLHVERVHADPVAQTSADVHEDAHASAIATVWAEVERARSEHRPSGIQIAAEMVSSWNELGSLVDPALRAGLATVDGHRVVMVVTDRRGGTGRPTPDGYRLAQRAIALAGDLQLRLVTLVDMTGADPGSMSENDAIAGEIARTFAALSSVQVPTLSVCVGEGGSGGALALAATDTLLMQEHSIFSVIAPEGAAAILARDASKAREYAPLLKPTSVEVEALGVADAVIGDDPSSVVEAVRRWLSAPAEVGHRLHRFDAVSATWLRP